MIKILRKHRNWLMILIAILALPFCLYFVKSDTSLIRSDEFAKMYGRKVTMTEARRDGGFLQLARFLGVSDLVDGLAPGTSADANQKIVTFVISLIVLRHDTERLSSQASDAGLVAGVN